MGFKKKIISILLILGGCDTVFYELYTVRNYVIEPKDILMESCVKVSVNNKEYDVWQQYPLLREGNAIDMELSDKRGFVSQSSAVRFRSAKEGCVLMSFTRAELRTMRNQGLEPVLTNDGVKIMTHRQAAKLPSYKHPLKNGLCVRTLEEDEKYLHSQKCMTSEEFSKLNED